MWDFTPIYASSIFNRFNTGVPLYSFFISLSYLAIIYGTIIFLFKRVAVVDIPKDGCIYGLVMTPVVVISGGAFLYFTFQFGSFNYQLIFEGYYGSWSFTIKYFLVSSLIVFLINSPVFLIKKKSVLIATYYGRVIDFLIIIFVSILVIAVVYPLSGMVITPSVLANKLNGGALISSVLIIIVANPIIKWNKKIFLETSWSELNKARKLPFDEENSNKAIKLLEGVRINEIQPKIDELIAWRYYYLGDYEKALKYIVSVSINYADRLDPHIIKSMILYRQADSIDSIRALYTGIENIKIFYLNKYRIPYFSASSFLPQKDRHKLPKKKELKKLVYYSNHIVSDKENRRTRVFALIGFFLYCQKKYNESRYWLERYLHLHGDSDHAEKEMVMNSINAIEKMKLAPSHA